MLVQRDNRGVQKIVHWQKLEGQTCTVSFWHIVTPGRIWEKPDSENTARFSHVFLAAKYCI